MADRGDGERRGTWLLLAAAAVSGVGTGLSAPYLYVYLHTARGFADWAVGALIASVGLAAMAGNLAGGAVIRRWGAKRVMEVALLLSATSSGTWAVVVSPWAGLAVAVLFGMSTGSVGPAQNVLLRSVVKRNLPAALSSVFAARYLGLGVGALMTLGVVGTVPSLQLVFLLNGMSYLCALVCVLPIHARAEGPSPQTPSGYRRVLRDPSYRRLWFLAALLATVGYGQLSVTIPVILIEYAGFGTHVLGAAFAVQTAVVLAIHPLVSRIGWSRHLSRAAIAIGVVWATAWLMITAVHLGVVPVPGIVAVLAAAALFALGETMIAPTLPAIANRLAPQGLHGHYNGAYVLSYSAGGVIGPMIASAALAVGLVLPLLIALIAGSMFSPAIARRLDTASAD